MGRKRCPECGKRVAEDELSCPRCGVFLVEPAAGAGAEGDVFLESDWDDGDWDDEGIDDPDLLDAATDYVRALPLNIPGSGMSLDEGSLPELPERGGALDQRAPQAEPGGAAPAGGECPVCGRQAQKGWQSCPWCRAPLG